MVEPPQETLPSEERRAQVRQAALDVVGPRYSGTLHLLAPSLVGIVSVAAAAWLIESPSVWEWLVIPATFVFSNAAEWRIHRDLLHKRSRIAPILYDEHTPKHHIIYVTDDMAMRSRDEYALVLIPPYGIFLIAVATFPVAAGFWALGIPNVGLFFLATAVGYATVYEWLHLSYHLPADHPVARLGLVRRLSRHHAIHHDPRLMQRWNFNVTLPLWDWVRGTIAREGVHFGGGTGAGEAGSG